MRQKCAPVPLEIIRLNPDWTQTEALSPLYHHLGTDQQIMPEDNPKVEQRVTENPFAKGLSLCLQIRLPKWLDRALNLYRAV